MKANNNTIEPGKHEYIKCEKESSKLMDLWGRFVKARSLDPKGRLPKPTPDQYSLLRQRYVTNYTSKQK